MATVIEREPTWQHGSGLQLHIGASVFYIQSKILIVLLKFGPSNYLAPLDSIGPSSF